MYHHALDDHLELLVKNYLYMYFCYLWEEYEKNGHLDYDAKKEATDVCRVINIITKHNRHPDEWFSSVENVYSLLNRGCWNTHKVDFEDWRKKHRKKKKCTSDTDSDDIPF